ncbi:MAG TPA: phosphatidate cytidylyltransferase, partial [Acidimicrobiales bacterium]|nr:phosphatidate cytidylyltransferase [Acidimicrobiales bacterium]
MDEREDYESDPDEVAEPVAERIRITGAEPAGEIMGLDEPQWAAAASDEAGQASPRAVEVDVGPGEASTGQTPAVDAGAAGATEATEPEPVLPDLPHWTEPPTGQVPAVLDRRGEDDSARSAGDAGPAWREHSHEWDEAAFEPSLLADEETRVGALDDAAPPEHLQWEFRELEDEAALSDADRSSGLSGVRLIGSGDEAPITESGGADESDERRGGRALAGAVTLEGGDPGGVEDVGVDRARQSATSVPAGTPSSPISVTSSELPVGRARDGAVGDAGAMASRRRRRGDGKERQSTGDRGAGHDGRTPPAGRRNVPVAVATGLGVAVVALVCFKLGTVATVAFATFVVTLASAECFAALRRAGMRPATLLGLVASAALMIAAYAKGVAAFPLVIALVIAATMIWYLVGAERGSPVRGISSTLLGFTWVGVLGAFAGLLLAPSQYPDRHGIAFLLGAIVAAVGEDVGALVVGTW